MSTIDDILTEALGLPLSERASLAHHLLLSLESEEFDSDCEAAWATEIETRMSAVARDEFVADDWREAIARIRKTLKKEGST